ncbi:MAG: helix-turn-helix domain-containing protein, partial [Vallitaleaceae bacterium]|nr:helix-turn-helix domain-containing protein [Vallitaleaceae bacterium]
IKAIQEIHPKVKIVIISAYEQFDYAKSGFELGVVDYLLKPIHKSRLENVLEKIVQEMEEERESKRKEIETQEKFDIILPMLEQGYIYSMLMNSDYQHESMNYFSLLNIQKEYGSVMIIEFGEGEVPLAMKNRIGSGIRSTLQYDKIRQLIQYKCKAIIGPLMVNRIVVIFFEDVTENEYEQRVRAVSLAESIQKSLERITETQVCIGIGSSYKRHRLNISYQEALRAISKMSGESVLHIRDVSDQNYKMNYNLSKLKSDQETMLRRMEEGNVEEVELIMQLIFGKLERDVEDDFDTLRNIVLEFMVLIHATANRNNVSFELIGFHQYIQEVQAFDTVFEMKDYLVQKAKSVTKAIREDKETKVSAFIQEAMSYVDVHYKKDLRLKEVAEEVSISPQYFSKVFKDELGYNFIDYLTKVRMEKAKLLLKDAKTSVKEICFEIGYNDPNYFSRLFKRLEGMSPTEFAELQK